MLLGEHAHGRRCTYQCRLRRDGTNALGWVADIMSIRVTTWTEIGNAADAHGRRDFDTPQS